MRTKHFVYIMGIAADGRGSGPIVRRVHLHSTRGDLGWLLIEKGTSAAWRELMRRGPQAVEIVGGVAKLPQYDPIVRPSAQELQ